MCLSHFNTVNTERKLLLKAMEHSEMDPQKDTPHPIAQYNTISNSQYSAENNASQFYDKALILLPNVGTADSCIKGTTHLTRAQLLRAAE